jgi:Flp pilus assembly protein TadG
MKVPFGSFRRKDRQTAQTLVFFLIAWGTIMLLCGLAIDSGLLYLAKARLSRAVDGAALAAVGNFNRSSNAVSNRDDVALIMRNFAAANFTDLSSVAPAVTASGGTPTTTTGSNGQSQTSYTYNFNDGTQDANGQYRRFVEVVLNTGSGGNITSATCNARCPVQTYFIGYGYYFLGNGQSKNYAKIGGYSGPTGLVDLKVSSSAVATRNPRLIMVVIDRSASMLQAGGGASGLPPAVVQFLDFFDTSSDYIGIVSFGSNARLEMPLTTNFIVAGTNDLIDAYNTNTAGGDAIPGLDPEDTNAGYATTGVRRLKFGGQTAADEGIRLAMEQLMANSGFGDPDVVKYMVIFTDGKWNSARTLLAAPGYTNEMLAPATNSTHLYLTNAAAQAMAQGQYTNGPDGTGPDTGPWSVNLTNDTNLVVMPSMSTVTSQSTMPLLTNAIAVANTQTGPVGDFTVVKNYLTNQTFQSQDTSGYEPLANPDTSLNAGAPMSVTNAPWLSSSGTTNYYSHNVDVWLTPGSVAYYYTVSTQGSPTAAYVSDYTDPSRHININLAAGGKIDLVVPPYIVDGIFFDGLDLPFSSPEDPNWPRYRCNNFQEAFMWNDDTFNLTLFNANPSAYVTTSLQRQLMFRNYPNLLTGFYVIRPDDPLSTATEPLDDTTPATQRPLYGLGPYYPGAGFYWPFDLVGIDYADNYALIDPTSDPDPANNQSYMGGGRHVAYSINMSSTAAAPEWAGELFYRSVNGGGTNVYSGTGSTSASQVMVSSDWKNGAPSWMSGPFQANANIMTNEAAHDTSITPNPSVYRPLTFTGGSVNQVANLNAITNRSDTLNYTGGYVSDGAGHVYRNAMAWSGRPTHYFDLSQNKWVPIFTNHATTSDVEALPLGNWKSREYCWHARALGVTIYTVGYGQYVSDAQQAFLATLANATNTTAGGGSNITYNPGQPIGQQFYATNSTQISNDFYSVGQAINEALTQ